MSKKAQASSLWAEEVAELGFEGAIIDRLKFHNALEDWRVAENTGYSIQTVRRWFAKWREKGVVVEYTPVVRHDDSEWIKLAPKDRSQEQVR